MSRQFLNGAALLLTAAAFLQPRHGVAEPVPAPNQEAQRDEQKPTLQVKGKVVDRSGKALANIEVTVEGPKGPVTKRTGATGAYNFEGPPGKYKITAKAANNKTATIEADVANNMELQPIVLNTED
jgi:hypothetical protein